MQMFLKGAWVDRLEKIPVLNPYDGSVVDTVPRASLEDVETALATAERGALVMAALPAHQRYTILSKAASRITERAEELARTITLEEGKSIGEARGEVARAVQTMVLSAEEAKRIHGETVPNRDALGNPEALDEYAGIV